LGAASLTAISLRMSQPDDEPTLALMLIQLSADYFRADY
jgi:hypothetical protein